MVDKEKIKLQIEKVIKKRESISAYLRDSSVTHTKMESMALVLEDLELWAEEDKLKDKLLTPELIKIKQNKIEELKEQLIKLNGIIRELLDKRLQEENDEKITEIDDERLPYTKEHIKLKNELFFLEWELMSEETRVKRRKSIVDLHSRWGTLLP